LIRASYAIFSLAYASSSCAFSFSIRSFTSSFRYLFSVSSAHNAVLAPKIISTTTALSGLNLSRMIRTKCTMWSAAERWGGLFYFHIICGQIAFPTNKVADANTRSHPAASRPREESSNTRDVSCKHRVMRISNP
jgi:hypothetical protein